MSDNTPTAPNAGDTPTDQSGTAPASQPSGFAPIASQDELDRIVEARLARERRKYDGFDELKEKASKFDEISEAQKTEAQKLAEQLEQFRTTAETATRENARLRVLAKHTIPEEYHDLVVGDSEDALTASAEKVKALIERTAPAPDRQSFVIPGEGSHPDKALNGEGIEAALRKALGMS
jgi:hypothetical protein